MTTLRKAVRTPPIGNVSAGLLLACVLCAGSQAWAAPEEGIYTCVDARGRKLTSDRPIPECNDREQKILNPSGTVKTKIGPKLTTQEALALEARKQAEQAERLRQEEIKKRDRALLIRYPTPEIHRKERMEALGHVLRVKQTAAQRVRQLVAEQQKLDEELAFYKKDMNKVPQKLHRQIAELKLTLKGQERFLAEQGKETTRINERFDDEVIRLTPLWQLSQPTAP